MTDGLQTRAVELPGGCPWSDWLSARTARPSWRRPRGTSAHLGLGHGPRRHAGQFASREGRGAGLHAGRQAIRIRLRFAQSALGVAGVKLVRTLDLPKPAKSPGESECQSVAISPDGCWLVTVAHRSWYREENGLHFGSAADGVVDVVWDLGSGKRVRRLAEGEVVLSAAAFTADGRLVLMGGNGNRIPAEGKRPAHKLQSEINLLDPLAVRLVRAFTPLPPTPGVQHRYIGTTLLSPDGRTLYVAYSTGAIVAFEVATGQPRYTFLDIAATSARWVVFQMVIG